MPFIARSAPEANPIRLVSLCCSLNSPVVSIPELPVGPASAAIAIHSDEQGGSQITVSIRCQRTASVAFFRAKSELGQFGGVSERAALLWAESMGFLFDEELCTTEGNQKDVRNRRAAEIWRQLVRDAESVSAAQGPRPESASIMSKFRWELAAQVAIGG